MAAVTKGSGRYFWENPRVWKESLEAGFEPRWVGNWGGKIPLPGKPTPDILKDLCVGKKFLKHVQKNRIGGFDLTFTFSKKVSILLYGLTPTTRWGESSRLLFEVARPEIEAIVKNQRANVGAQGQKTTKSVGGAAVFVHGQTFRGPVGGHVQCLVPNVTMTEKGTGSIENTHGLLYESQGVRRARTNKWLDDRLQALGFNTVREGLAVGIAGIPEKMVEELSPARRAMNQARAQKKFSGAKANDFYARDARRGAGPGYQTTPEQAAAEVQQLAKKYSVTLDGLKRPKGTPPPAHDKYTACSTAHDVALRARDECAARHGGFTAAQFQERLYTLAIGTATTLEALDAVGKTALSKQSFIGVTKSVMADGTALYHAPAPKSAAPNAGQTHGPGAGQTVRPGAAQKVAQAYRPDTAEAWRDLKSAAAGLGAAVLVKTAGAATDALKRLAEAVNPPPRTMTIDARDLPKFLARYRPTNYVLAHAKALLKGAFAPGNPHEKAGVAEKVFAALRRHQRLPKNTVVVVTNGRTASARDLHLLSKVARRDGASVLLAGRPDPDRGRNKNHTHNHRHKAHRRSRGRED